ncbi:MAG: TonB-dependent receptor [Gammaproteobacteria bacterium]
MRLQRASLFGLTATALTLVAHADETSISEVVVTATRVGAPIFNVPAAISRLSGEDLREAALGVNLADDVASIPGLLARNRNNYAQDQQISIRGIGANSAFGIRGVRVYQDGIPATGPDGQGQVSQFNLDSADHVEVLRGPFSALYGNSSGGVIQLFTADGKEPAEFRTSLAYGSFDTMRAGVSASGTVGQLGYNAAFTHFKVDGYRDHSEARNESFNGKADYTFAGGDKLTVIANIVSRPDAQDPLGLTPAQFAEDPHQSASVADQFNTRKSLEQQQGGLIYDMKLSDSQSVRLLGYYGHRDVLQYLSIPQATQAPATSAGGVVDLNRKFGGADARWAWQSELAGRPLTWIVGASYDRQNELRQGYNNFVGATLGVKGALRRDENNITYDVDAYTQGTWDFADAWSATLGVRRSEVHFDSEDHFITGTNGDDSGGVTYDATSPVAGLVFKAASWIHLYASYGQGFQTPLGSELAYRADGTSGLNLGLKPARSNNTEAGAKLQFSSGLTGEATVFRALTNEEIVVSTNAGGRSTYQNAGRTRRSGAELALNYRFAENWRAQIAYTYVEALYSDGYLTCTAAPCRLPTSVQQQQAILVGQQALPANTAIVAGGNRLPGVPKSNLFASLRWGGELGWQASATGQYITNVAVNDVNTVLAPSYAVFGLSGGYGMELPSGRLNTFVRVNNLFDRDYVGSVIVNDGNGRFFEPGPGTNWLAGFSVTFK